MATVVSRPILFYNLHDFRRFYKIKSAASFIYKMGLEKSGPPWRFYNKIYFLIKSFCPEVPPNIISTSLKFQATPALSQPDVAPTCRYEGKGIRGGGTRAKTTFYTRVVGIADTADPTLRSGSPLRAPAGALRGPYCAPSELALVTPEGVPSGALPATSLRPLRRKTGDGGPFVINQLSHKI